MKADEVYAKLKKMIGLVSVGMKNTTSTQNPDGSVTITINFTSGSPLSFTMTPVKGDKGVGIKDAQIKEIQNGENTEYHLILIDDKDNNIDTGNIPIPSAGSNPDITNLATKSDLTTHASDTNIHITSAERNKWNAKLDNTDLKDYAKKVDVNSSLYTKVDKVTGKSLVDDTEIARLATINNYDDSTIKQSINAKASISDVNTHTSDTVKHITSAERTLWNTVSNKSDKTHTHTKSQITDMPTKLSQFSNDSGFITSADVDTSKNHIHNNKAVLDGITSDLITDWNNKAEISDIPNLTNYATKTYVTDEIAKAATGGTVDLSGYAKTVDVNSALDTKVDKVSGKSLISDTEIVRLAKVNNYDDTSIRSSITNINSQLDTKANKSDLFSGSYNDLTDKPTIPSLEGYATQSYVTDEINKASLSGTVDLSKYTTTDKAVTNIELVDAIPTGSTGTTEKCLRLTFADGTTVVDVSVNDLVGSDEKQKTIVCIIDDDGTNRTGDKYTGMTTWLNDKGIPMNFAICHDTIGTSGKYTVTELQELQANGNDILIHGNPKLTTLADETEVIAEIESALQFHTSNGLKPTNIYVYPQGLNSDGTLTATQVKEIVGRYFDYALNVNIASMSGEDTRGLWNKVPLVDKLNIARMEVSSTKGFDTNKSKIDACIENKGLLILFTHSFMSQFTSGGYDEFKKIINYLLTKDVEFLTVSKALDKVEKIVKNYDDTQVKADIADLQSNKVDKVDGKGLSTNDYTAEEKTKVGKIVTNGNGTTFLSNDGTYKKVGSSASSVAERKFKPVFGFDTYWGEMRDTHGNKNQVDLVRIKEQIDQCESMKVDRIICTVHIGWDETTNSLVIAENTDSLLSAISYCADKNVTIDTVKVHLHVKGSSKSEKDYVNDVIGMSTFQSKYKPMLTTICNLFKNTTVTRIIILNEMWYITNANLGYSSFVNECLNIVKSAGYTTGLSMAGFNTNLQLSNAVIQNLDTFYINVYPGISGSGKYITKLEAIEAFNQCDVDLWIVKLKKDYPNKKIVISEIGTNDYWESLACPSSWQVSGTSKTGGYAVDTYITAMLEFFINKNVEIEELWWWYDLYYEPVKETLLNYLGGDR